ncbi:MAG TPA: glycosyltransferase [Actinomycetota bacterium]|nr:glycosyltransferase [Actinomycetota bacterium]
MRVLQLYRDHFADLPGGIERHVHDLAHGLAPVHQMEVVASAKTPRQSTVDPDGVVVHVEREFARVGGVPLAPRIFKRVRDGYDIVHMHSPNPTGELACWKLGGKTAVVATYHADTTRAPLLLPAYGRWLEALLAGCDRVIVGSQRLVEASPVLRKLSRHPSLIQVIPFGVDAQRFSPAEGPAIRRWGPDPIVLFVGRLRYYKGLPFLIEAMSKVQARLVIVGDGQERERVVGLGRERLGDRFTYLPGIPEEELATVYRSADVFCLPSTSEAEAFGLAALEAMACGVPVVTTEVGTATSEINVDGETGLVVPPSNAGALSEALRLLLEDSARRHQMGAAARARVLAEYTRDLMLRRVSQVYEQVLADRRLA